MRMYHPDLGLEVVFPDDPTCIAVQEEAGWVEAPEEKAPSGAHAPAPVKYAPVDPDAEADQKPKSGSKSTSAAQAKSKE